MTADMRAQRSADPDPLAPLLAAAARGDEGAMGQLYDATAARVLGWTMRILRDRELAAEATNDVYAQAWKQADRHDPARGPVSAWLCVMARSRALDLARARRRDDSREEPLASVPDLAADVPGPAARFESSERAQAVRKALEQLPEEQRDALVAAYHGGMTHAEVAQHLDEPLGTVKTRIRRGLEALRRGLHREHGGRA